MSVLVINAGSSSVKFGLFDFDTLACRVRAALEWPQGDSEAALIVSPVEGRVSRAIRAPDHRAAATKALEFLVSTDGPASSSRPICVVGHRLICGGESLRQPVAIDDRVKEVAESYADLAPLHIPAGLEAVAAMEEALPGIPQVGVFDTAFFGELPPAEYIYPLPYQWYEEWGIRRFGYHGISHAYCAERATEMLRDRAGDLRLILCHLGQGCSATAVRGGVALTNSLGYTSLEGLPMGTRCGSVDPGVLLHVQRRHGLSCEELSDVLHKRSGLLGISGLSGDIRELEAAAVAGHERARLAIDVFARRIRSLIGSLAVTMGGVDAIVFTGGIGENSPALRTEVCDGLECLGVELDQEANRMERPDCDVAAASSRARILLIHTREDLMIAREAKRLAGADQAGRKKSTRP